MHFTEQVYLISDVFVRCCDWPHDSFCVFLGALDVFPRCMHNIASYNPACCTLFTQFVSLLIVLVVGFVCAFCLFCVVYTYTTRYLRHIILDIV